MMTKDQQETVTKVLRNFSDSEAAEQKWTDIDEKMYMIDWMSDTEIVVEAAVLYQLQSAGQPRCNRDHPIGECFIPTAFEAVGYILNLYGETGYLHLKNRFILAYYLALTQVGYIVS